VKRPNRLRQDLSLSWPKAPYAEQTKYGEILENLPSCAVSRCGQFRVAVLLAPERWCGEPYCALSAALKICNVDRRPSPSGTLAIAAPIEQHGHALDLALVSGGD
jgi:hypothetical protein